jgi:prepilin-type N-terminal cleavage/methylation domain-containing protein
MAHRRNGGFTLIELVVAMTLSGVVLLGARALWESLAVSVDRLRTQATADAREVNGERLLRSLMGQLEVGTDQSHEFAGDEHHVRFTTWCDMPAGWQERCDAVIGIEPDSGAGLRLVARLSTGEAITLQRGFGAGVLRYLNDPAGGGVWFRIWGHGITAPLAVGVITDGDTAIVRIGERG